MSIRNEIKNATKALFSGQVTYPKLLEVKPNPHFTIMQKVLDPLASNEKDGGIYSIATAYSLIRTSTDLRQAAIRMELSNYLDSVVAYYISVKTPSSFLSLRNEKHSRDFEIEESDTNLGLGIDDSGQINFLEYNGDLKLKHLANTGDPREWIIALNKTNVFELIHPTLILRQIIAGKLPFGLMIEGAVGISIKRELRKKPRHTS